MTMTLIRSSQLHPSSSPSSTQAPSTLQYPREAIRACEGGNARKVGSSRVSRRGALCYVVSPFTTRTFVLSKSTWIDMLYAPEHEIHDKLFDEQMCLPYIAPGSLRRTPERNLGHYNVVLDQIGEELRHFPSTHVLVTAILHAIIAHSDVMAKAQILHRDVSPSNIVIVKGKDGLPEGRLIDWECSVNISSDSSKFRGHLGSFQFMATAINRDPSIRHTLPHDLESFIWVLTHMAILYAPGDLKPRERGDELAFFDCFSSKPGSLKSFMYKRLSFAECLQLQSKPLTSLLSSLLSAVRDSYLSSDEWDSNGIDRKMRPDSKVVEVTESTEIELSRNINKESADEKIRLLNHDWIIATFRSFLNDEEWKAEKDHHIQIQKVCLGRAVFYVSDPSTLALLAKIYS